MKAFAPRILYIALDAAARNLVLRWCEQGLLPNIRFLLKGGTWRMTHNARAIYTGSLWPSVWTGTSPGQHGCYYNEQIVPGTYQIGEFLSKDVRAEPFWNQLSQQGYRICLFDVPKAPLSDQLNGIHIVDWGTHDADVPACSRPPGVLDEITREFGPPPFRRCDWVMDGARPEQTLLNSLLQRVKTKTAIAGQLLRREPWDLFMLGFGDSHCVGHQLWHLRDPTHAWHDPEIFKRMGDPIKTVYMALDDAVGSLLQYAGESTMVVLHCSHGMSAHYDASHLLDEVLRRLHGQSKPRSRTLLDSARKQWKKLPVGFTERFATVARAVDRLPDAADRAGRPCFVVPTNANAAGIRLNLVGREPAGKIQPGREAEEFVAGLISELKTLVDPSDGRALVREVIRSQEAFPGAATGLLPDLFVQWHRRLPISGVSAPGIGTLWSSDYGGKRSGDHRPGGLFLMQKNGKPVSGLAAIVNDEDIAPTLADCLGTTLHGVSGRSALEAQPRSVI